MNRLFSWAARAVENLRDVARSKLRFENMIPHRNSPRGTAFVSLLAAFSLPLICAAADDAQSPVNAASAAADSLRCPLQAGAITFVVQLPKGRDRFTFINENTAARGELKLSVSKEKLAIDDPRWTSVDGTISFKHKRLFNLSMVGVEANYVKLSFYVAKGDRMAAIGR